MRATQNEDTVQSKQRLRTEISSHVEDFLHNGGRIEVVQVSSHIGISAKTSHRPVAVDLALLASLVDE